MTIARSSAKAAEYRSLALVAAELTRITFLLWDIDIQQTN